MLANNQGGKTVCGSQELGFHLTGRYPRWWTGVRFEHPIKAWAANTNIETTRDNPQRLLLGEDCEANYGTGAIPLSCLDRPSFKQVPGAVDRVRVKHVSGQWSRLNFKAYDQKREKWQGETLHFIWFDEEPPADVYSEGLARISMATNGRTILTATPLLGMTKVITYFYPEPDTKDRSLTMVDIESCGLYTPEQIEKIVAGYQPHEREARTKGIPMLGSGRVFPVAEGVFVRPWRQLPTTMPWVIGLDFGWDHPTAAVKCAYDLHNDHFYVTDEYRQSEEAVVFHARALKAMGGTRVPVVWPQDGWQRDPRSAMSTADLYRKEGIFMWPEHATFADGGYGVNPGVLEMLDRMRTGRLTVFDNCVEWLQEFRTYHRKDGNIVKLHDDLISASRYALMMRRFGRPDEEAKPLTGRVPMGDLDWDPNERFMPGLR